MRAYLINPFDQTVTAVEVANDYRAIYPLIDAHAFDVARIGPERDALFVDDEGMMREPDTQAFFLVEGYAHPVAGKALCLGCDDEGRSTAPQATLEELRNRVVWCDSDGALARRDFNADMTKANAIARGYDVQDCGNGVMVITSADGKLPQL